MEAGNCLGDDADMLQDLGIGFVPGGPTQQQACSRLAAPLGRTPARSHASPAHRLSWICCQTPTWRPRRLLAMRQRVRSHPSSPLRAQVLQQLQNSRGTAQQLTAAGRSPSVDRLLADMVDLLSGSEDDDQDAALAAALAAEERLRSSDGGRFAGRIPAASQVLVETRPQAGAIQGRRRRARLAAGAPSHRTAQRWRSRCRGPTVWPSPPEDSFINDDEPAHSAPADVLMMRQIPSPQPKRREPCVLSID